MKVLGIESSCDETAASVVKNGREVLSNVISSQIAYVIAYILYREPLLPSFPYVLLSYRTLGLVILLCDALVAIAFNTMHLVLKRGYLVEMKATIVQSLLAFLAVLFLLFFFKISTTYSRSILLASLTLHVLIGYASRIAWKKILQRKNIVNIAPDIGI